MPFEQIEERKEEMLKEIGELMSALGSFKKVVEEGKRNVDENGRLTNIISSLKNDINNEVLGPSETTN